MPPEIAKRLKKLALLVLVLAGLGAGGLVLFWAGLGVPCLFHTVTGLYCPGCGGTHLVAALVQGNFAAALRANPAFFVLSPAFAFLAVRLTARWVRTGTIAPTRAERVLLWCCIGALVVFGILRNLPFYPY